MILRLNKPIEDINGQKIKKLEYDFNLLTVKDLEKAEQLYFLTTQGVEIAEEEMFFYRGSSVFSTVCFYLACLVKKPELSFINILSIDGDDARKIVEIAEEFNFNTELLDKKKDLSTSIH